MLLAAGQGSRLWPLTEKRPKSLLEMGGKTVLETILDPLLDTGPREVVVVTGFEKGQMHDFVSEKYGARGVRTVENKLYLEDTNILSTQIGVSALKNPEKGYFIIETDIIAPPVVWKTIADQENHLGSFWVTRGVYGRNLTGGIVRINEEGSVIDIRYEPTHDPKFDGWAKMLGVLGVGPEQVAADVEARALLAAQSTSQYYMASWITHAARLPCHAYDLKDQFAMSFNTKNDYQAAYRAFVSVKKD